MSEARIRLGDRVRIVSLRATDASEFTGRIGTVYGWTTSITVGTVIGEYTEYAYNIWFEDLLTDAWFAPTLVEFVDHPDGTESMIEVQPLAQDDRPEREDPPQQDEREPEEHRPRRFLRRQR